MRTETINSRLDLSNSTSAPLKSTAVPIFMARRSCRGPCSKLPDQHQFSISAPLVGTAHRALSIGHRPIQCLLPYPMSPSASSAHCSLPTVHGLLPTALPMALSHCPVPLPTAHCPPNLGQIHSGVKDCQAHGASLSSWRPWGPFISVIQNGRRGLQRTPSQKTLDSAECYSCSPMPSSVIVLHTFLTWNRVRSHLTWHDPDARRSAIQDHMSVEAHGSSFVSIRIHPSCSSNHHRTR